jgi:hypothetical protein
MRRVAKNCLSVSLAAGNSGGAGGTRNELNSIIPTTFEQYGSVVRFSNSMSILKRLRCYLLTCMSHNIDIPAYIHKLVDKDTAAVILNLGVIVPHQESVSVAIQSLAMNGAPFQALNLFRDSCFSFFSLNQRMGINLSQVLHLYIAAYQRKDIWKECWKFIYPIMSSQISKSVELFVHQNPLAVVDVMHLLSTNVTLC